MKALISYVSHRAELLPLLLQLVKKCKKFVLEEPMTVELKKLLSGEMNVKEYVMWADTTFPVYTTHFAKILLDLKSKGVEILPVEPYLEVIEGIHRAVEENRYEEYVKDEVVQKVLKAERAATGALIEYQKAFMSRDFDLVVESTLKFAKADANRFVLRDEMRARKIAEIDGEYTVEAGQMHFLLEDMLKDLIDEVKSVNLVEKAAEIAGIKYVKNPGNELTEMYIREIAGENFEGDEELLAAQALVYISLLKKEEMLPTAREPFPHLKNEVTCAKIAKSMNYGECRKFIERVWFKKDEVTG